MKNFVITIKDNERSVKAAQRCIDSGKRFNKKIINFFSFTPKYGIEKLLQEKQIRDKNFRNSLYSREDNAIAAFCSHFTLWEHCVNINEPITIFEHDAVIVNDYPDFIHYNLLINLGKPSYGEYRTPYSLGVNELYSKDYFGGAHAYQIKPAGAKLLITVARKGQAGPTDIFLHKQRFRWLEEYYPWPVEVKDNFSTIQNEYGCLNKHGYNKEKYILEQV